MAQGEPILARRAGAAERALKWARRRPALAALLAVCLAAAVVAAVGGWLYTRQLQDFTTSLQSALHDADEERKRAQERELEARQQVYASDVNLAQQALEKKNLPRLRELLDGMRPERTGGHELRGFEWYYLWGQAHGARQTLTAGQRLFSVPRRVAFSPDGGRIAAWGTQRLWLWDATTGEPRPITDSTRCPPDISAVAFSPDGKRLVTASSGPALVVRDAGSGEIVEEHPQAGGDNARLFVVSFSPDGKWLAGMDSRQGVFLWAVTDKGVTPRPVHRITGRGERWSMAFSSDGKLLATADGTEEQGKYAEVVLWATGIWNEVGRLRPDPAPNTTLVGSLAFSADGKRLAVAHGWHEGENRTFTAGDASVKIWEVAARKQPASLSGRYHFAAMTPDGKSLVACDANDAVVFDLASNNPRASVLFPGAGVVRAALAPDGRLFALARTDGTLRLCETATCRVLSERLAHGGYVFDVTFSPDGKTLVTCGEPGIKLWDVDGLSDVVAPPRQGPFPGLGSSTYHLTTADGRLVADVRDDGTIHVRRAGADRPVVIPANSAVRSVALSADGSRLASSIPNEAGVVRVWDTRSGEPVAVAPVVKHWTLLALSADGKVLASLGGRELTFWDADTGRQRRTVPIPLPPDWDASSLRFTPDGKRLFVEAGGRVAAVGVADDFRFQLVEEGPGTRLAAPVSLSNAEGRYAVAVSPDGRRLATKQTVLNAADPVFRILDLSAASPREIPIPDLGAGARQLQALSFSPDDTVLATANSAGQRRTLVELWDAATGKRQAALTVPGPVEALGLSPDHTTVATAGGRRLRLWDVASALPRLSVRLPIDLGSPMGVRFTPDAKAVCVTWGRDNHGDLGQPLRGLAMISSSVTAGSTFFWDSASGRRLDPLGKDTGKTGEARAIALSADGALLAVASEAGRVRLYDVASHCERPALEGHPAAVDAVALSPDGRLLASGCADGSLVVWDVASAARQATVKAHAGAVTAVAFAPDGARLTTGGTDGIARVWDVSALRDDSGAALALDAGGPVRTLGYAPDGKGLAAAAGDWRRGAVRLWDAATGRERSRLDDLAGGVRSLALADDDTLALGGDDGRVRLWDPAAGRVRGQPADAAGHTDPVTAVAFRPDGKRFLSASLDGALLYWDKASLRPEAPPAPSPVGITALVTALSGEDALAWIDEEGDVRGHERHGLDAVIQPASRAVTVTAVSPDGKTEARGTADKLVLLAPRDGAGQTRVLRGHGGPIAALAFPSHGGALASVSTVNGDARQCQVKLWDTTSGREVLDQRYQGAPFSLCFSPDGSALATLAGDRVRLWNHDGEQAWESDPLGGQALGVGFSADGTRLAAGDGGGLVTVWDAADLGHAIRLKGHEGAVNAVAFAPDGRSLATAGQDGTVRLWNTVSGRPLLVLTGHTGPVLRLRFEDDGRTLVSEGPERRSWRTARPEDGREGE